MDWTSILTTILGSLASTAGLGGIFSALYLRKENKRQKQLENLGTSNDQWQEIVKELREETSHAQTTIDKKDAKIETLYNEIAKLHAQNNELSTTLAQTKIFKCITIECPNRKPPMDALDIKEPAQK